jgi:hypothetical protein
MAESRRAMTERHVRDGRQRALVAGQRTAGHDIRTSFERSLAVFEDDLRAIRGGSK